MAYLLAPPGSFQVTLCLLLRPRHHPGLPSFWLGEPVPKWQSTASQPHKDLPTHGHELSTLARLLPPCGPFKGPFKELRSPSHSPREEQRLGAQPKRPRALTEQLLPTHGVIRGGHGHEPLASCPKAWGEEEPGDKMAIMFRNGQMGRKAGAGDRASTAGAELGNNEHLQQPSAVALGFPAWTGVPGTPDATS